MTSTELALFKELIKECVRDVIKQELKKTLLEHAEVKKDLLVIKKLIAKNIQESRKTASGYKPAIKNVLAEQARRAFIEETEEAVEINDNRSWEETQDGLFRIFGGKEGFERSTMASKPLIDGASSPNKAGTPVGNSSAINSILQATKSTMTDEDRAYIAQGVQEAKSIIPQAAPTPPLTQVDQDEFYTNDKIPDFDMNMLRSKRGK